MSVPAVSVAGWPDDQPCIVLAGGLGTRLRTAVADRPKCLAPVGHRSFLEVQLRMLQGQGFRRFVLSLGHMAGMVEQAVRDMALDADIRCVVEEQLLGTGGAVLHAMVEVGADEATVVNGDTYLGAELGAMRQKLALDQGELARMALVNVPDRNRYGGVVTTGALVTSFVEKGQAGPGLINAGVYRIHRQAFAEHRHGTAFSLETAILPALLRSAALHATLLDGEFIDIGIPEDYHRFCAQHGQGG